MNILKPILENLAERLAAERGGRITPNDLVPYVPVSLSMIESHLAEMADGCVVIAGEDDGVRTYTFPELVEAGTSHTETGLCVYCGHKSTDDKALGMCWSCLDHLGKELLTLAGMSAWPAEAVWQHELLFITSTAEGPIRIADVAGRSRLTLSQVKQKLKELAVSGYARAVLDSERGFLTYQFPPIVYPPESYQRNDAFIRLHPSSLQDEWEVRIIKSLMAIVVIFAICFGLAFMRIPLSLLVLAGGLASALSVWRIVHKRRRVEPGQLPGRGDGVVAGAGFAGASSHRIAEARRDKAPVGREKDR